MDIKYEIYSLNETNKNQDNFLELKFELSKIIQFHLGAIEFSSNLTFTFFGIPKLFIHTILDLFSDVLKI